MGTIAFLVWEAVQTELNGGVKTAAACFFAAWAIFAFIVYLSDLWVKSRKSRALAIFVTAMIGVGVFLFWRAYLPNPPRERMEAAAQPQTAAASPQPTAKPTTSEAPIPPRPIRNAFEAHQHLPGVEKFFPYSVARRQFNFPVRVATGIHGNEPIGLVVYIDASVEYDVFACVHLLQNSSTIRQKMSEAVNSSTLTSSNKPIPPFITIYHEGYWRRRDVELIKSAGGGYT